MSEAIIFCLPQVPDAEKPDTHWWHVVDGAIASSGDDAAWLRLAQGGPGQRPKRIAIAPSALVRLAFGEPARNAATERQAAAIARLAVAENSLGDAGTLHFVSRPAGPDRIVTAVAENGVMLAWIEWAEQLEADPDHIVPAAALLPLGDSWRRATIGSERVIGRHDVVLPLEPGLSESIVGDAPVEQVSEEQLGEVILAAVEDPPLDLRSGRFARRRRILVDRKRIRELALLAASLPLITLTWSIASILQLESATDRLDSQTLAVAESALGRPVALESAESELAQRFGASAHGGLMPPLTALYQALQSQEAVGATMIGYRSDGTLSATLAAATVDPINQLLVALQRNGYRITAVPRQSADGRAMVETTVRSGP